MLPKTIRIIGSTKPEECNKCSFKFKEIEKGHCYMFRTKPNVICNHHRLNINEDKDINA